MIARMVGHAVLHSPAGQEGDIPDKGPAKYFFNAGRQQATRDQRVCPGPADAAVSVARGDERNHSDGPGVLGVPAGPVVPDGSVGESTDSFGATTLEHSVSLPFRSLISPSSLRI